MKLDILTAKEVTKIVKKMWPKEGRCFWVKEDNSLLEAQAELTAKQLAKLFFVTRQTLDELMNVTLLYDDFLYLKQLAGETK